MKRLTILLALVLFPALAQAQFGGLDVGLSDISIGDVGVDVGDVVDVVETGQQLVSGFEEFTPEQEYYIGRSVAAIVLGKYKPYNNAGLTKYVNKIGQTLAQASDVPQLFGGYHFLVLDSKEINAFATPGGHVFVTRGMLDCCESEDAVAAVLAHEIGHIVNRHGIRTIQNSRITGALTSLAATGIKAATPAEISEVTDYFEGSLTDITETMINSGYSREFEREADASALTILDRVGYDQYALVDVLKVMKTKIKPGGMDFAKTHPDPADRMAEVEEIIGTYERPDHQPRVARFNSVQGNF